MSRVVGYGKVRVCGTRDCGWVKATRYRRSKRDRNRALRCKSLLISNWCLRDVKVGARSVWRRGIKFRARVVSCHMNLESARNAREESRRRRAGTKEREPYPCNM